MAVRKQRNGEKWEATYRDADGKERQKTLATKAEALRFERAQRADVDRGDWVDPNAGLVTFREYAEEWRPAQVHRPSSAAQVESHLRRHIYPTFGDRRIGSIRSTEVQAWVRDRSRVLAPSTIESVYGWVATIFRAAVHDGVVRRSPCVKIKLPKKEPTSGRVTPITVKELDALIAATPERFRAAVVVAAGTGLRPSEVFGLTVDRVDFLRRRVTVDRQLVLHEESLFGPPKSAASVRTVPLPQVVVDALAEHLQRFGPGVEGLLFSHPDGRPVTRQQFNEQTWRPAVKAAKVSSPVRFHDLRHFYASLLIRHGESVKVVQERLGHASAVETLNTYSHLWPDSEDRTREAIDGVLTNRLADLSRTSEAAEAR